MNAFTPMPATQVAAEITAMHALAGGLTEDRNEIVALLVGAWSEAGGEYDRLLAKAEEENARG